MPDELRRVDPPGCGCTDCITGHSTPLDQASDEEVHRMLLGLLHDASGLDREQMKARMRQARIDFIREYIEVRRG